jgi:hypothetical protein
MIRPVIPERLVQAAVKAGLDAVREPLASTTRLPCLDADADEWEDKANNESEPASPDRRCAKRLRFVPSVVGFDSPSAEGADDVPWFAD